MTNYPFFNKNGKYRPNSKEWSDSKANIMQAKKQFNISDDEFRMLSPYENYQGIQEKIYQTFCNLQGNNSRVCLTSNFKQPQYSISDDIEILESYLAELIEPNEKIWFLVADWNNKRWLYESDLLTIQKLLPEIYSSEICFVSKKYQWLICIDDYHLDTLYATGGDMPQKLENLHKQILAKENKQ